jgi:hypothetical protein
MKKYKPVLTPIFYFPSLYLCLGKTLQHNRDMIAKEFNMYDNILYDLCNGLSRDNLI